MRRDFLRSNLSCRIPKNKAKECILIEQAGIAEQILISSNNNSIKRNSLRFLSCKIRI